MKKLELRQISLETKIGKETFVPILELCYMALRNIYGDKAEKHCTHMVEVYNNNDEDNEFGVVTHYFDTRIGFSLTLKNGNKEFEISADGRRLMIDQLQLFDKLRTWGFLV